MAGSYAQWLRACSLIVADDQDGIELAGLGQPQLLRIRFTVHYPTVQTPASLSARIYNLSDQTVQKLVDLVSKNPASASGGVFVTTARVVLKAGYENNIGTVFEGQAYQLRIGKESSTDSYVDIFASDGDFAHCWANMRKSFAKGYSAATVWEEAGKSMQTWGVTPGAPPKGLSSAPSPRGRVVYGMTRDVLRDEADTHNFTWNVVGGQLVGVPRFSVRDDEAIVINSQTGMAGSPEQTEQGVTAMMLLNPAVRWGTKLQINERDVQRLVVNSPGLSGGALLPVSPTLGAQKSFVPPLNKDGIYVVLYATHIGDTRGHEWYTRVICLSVDPTAQLPLAVPQTILPPPIGH